MTNGDRAGGRTPCNHITDLNEVKSLLGVIDLPAAARPHVGPPFLSLDEMRVATGVSRIELEQHYLPANFAMQDKSTGQTREFFVVPDCYIAAPTPHSQLAPLGFEERSLAVSGGFRLIAPVRGFEEAVAERRYLLRETLGPVFSPLVVDHENRARYFTPLGIDVWFAPGTTPDRIADLASVNAITIEWQPSMPPDAPRYVLGRCRPQLGLDALTTVLRTVETLQQNAEVRFAEPAEVGVDDFGPDPVFQDPTGFEAADSRWNLEQIGIEEAHGISRGDRSVTILVIDSGMELDHPDLTSAIRADWIDHDLNYSIDDPPAATSPAAGQISHGTKVASVTSGQAPSDQGVLGIAPECRLIPLKIAGRRSGAGYGARAAAIHQALSLIRPGGRGVLNLSWGMQGDHTGIREALVEADRRDVPIATSAGNYAPGRTGVVNETHYPSAYGHLGPRLGSLCAVAATNSQGQVATYSYFGDQSVTVAAPGGEAGGSGTGVYVSDGGASRSYSYGTSFASPHVAGALALLLSVRADMSAGQAVELLRNTSRPVRSGRPVGAGALDLSAAVSAAVEGSGGTGTTKTSVNINSAPGDVLAEVLQISAWLARKTVEHRETVGQYRSAWDLVFSGVWDFWLITSRRDRMRLSDHELR